MVATQAQQNRWIDACLIAQLITIDPQGLGGVWVKSSAGPVRDNWLTFLQNTIADQIPYRKIPPQTDELALLGGIDIFQTLQLQKKVHTQGILDQIDGGILVLTMAERLEMHTAALITQAYDLNNQFGVIAIDESIHAEEEQLLPRIQDRLAFMIQLDDLSYFDCQLDNTLIDLAKIRDQLKQVEIPDIALEAIITAASGLGINSVRAISFAVRASKVLAALRGSNELIAEDIRTATRLVFSHRVTRLPQESTGEEEQQPKQQEQQQEPSSSERPNSPQDELSPDQNTSSKQEAIPTSKEAVSSIIL